MSIALRTMLRTLSTAVGFADDVFVAEREVLNTHMDALLNDGYDALCYEGVKASCAESGLREINLSCSRNYSPASLRLCIEGYRQFLLSSSNMEAVSQRAAELLLGLLHVDWQSELGLTMLRERLMGNLNGKYRYVFETVGEAWQEVAAAMRELMVQLVGLLDKLWQAAKSKAKPSDWERQQREQNYRKALSEALCAKENEWRERFDEHIDSYDSVDELISEWRKMHEFSADTDNPFIGHNLNGRRNVSQMANFIASYRDRNDVQDALDAYFRYAAFFAFLDKMSAEFRNTERPDPRNAEDFEPTVVRDENGTNYYISGDLHIDSVMAGETTFRNSIVKQYIEKIDGKI